MLIRGHLVPKDVELGTDTDILSDLIDFIDTFIVDDDLQICGLIWVDHTC